MKRILLAGLMLCSFASASQETDVLIKLKSSTNKSEFSTKLIKAGATVDRLGGEWLRVQSHASPLDLKALRSAREVAFVQPNFKLSIYKNPTLANAEVLAKAEALFSNLAGNKKLNPDNPEILAPQTQATGKDPMLARQWGMLDIGAPEAWKVTKGNPKMVVAVIDTGVDYTHPDLVNNMWRNPGEMGKDANGNDKATNGVDDDKNGYIDDQIGWDFVSGDNTPYDLASNSVLDLLTGTNPGHGTHCAGNVAARSDNAAGISGVAPRVSLMALRFLSEKGSGTTADAVKAIRYAVDNGARVLSNSWGSEGEDTENPEENEALKEAIRYAEKKDVLFIAAAGNGRAASPMEAPAGYDNDSDPKPAYPASYDMDNIISVAAIDATGELGSFSNYGLETVDLGAPGVRIFSTTVTGKYNDTVINIPGLIEATWDGTSMATPHVAGAAALYWSKNPKKTSAEVKAALLKSTTPTSFLKGKVLTGGKLNVAELIKQ